MSASETQHSGSRPRLLIVTTVPETLATILCGQPAFLAQHFDVHLATSPGPMFERVGAQERIRPNVVAMQRGISPLADLRSILNMVRVLRRVRPDIVHSYTPKAGLVAMLAGWLCQVPVRVHTFTGLLFPTAHGARQRLLLAVDRVISAAATRIVPEGEGVRQDLLRFRVTRKPLVLIGHGNIAGVDCQQFSPDQPEVQESASNLAGQLGVDQQRDFLFCFIGRLNADKGLSELVQAFSGMPAWAHLIIAGAVDDSAPPDQQTLSRLRGHPRVHLIGFSTDVRPALALSRALVLPSYREGFPNVVLQAGAMGLPAITTDINGCNEAIQAGKNGWLVPPRDAAALQDAMMSALLLPPERLRAMGTRAKERVRKHFHRPEHWQRMLVFYRQLLVGSRRLPLY